MLDLQAVGTALTSLKTAGDIAKSFLDLKEHIAIQQKVFELQQAIISAQQSTLSAQQTQSELISTNRKLEDKLAAAQVWNEEKGKYILCEVGTGTIAYVLRDQFAAETPPHMICAACYENSNKSILQRKRENYYNKAVYFCPACAVEIIVDKFVRPDAPPPTPQVIVDYDPFGRGTW